MRNRICLAAAVLCALAGAPAAAQVRTGSVLDRRVTVTFNQAPLESVLRTLRRQYGVRISYSNTALNLRQPVTLTAQNQPLRAVLSEVLEGKNIGYELVGDQLVLHPAPPRPAPAKPTATAAPAAGSTAARPAADKAPDNPAPRPAAEAPKAPVREEPAREPARPAAPTRKPAAKPARGTTVASKAGTAARGTAAKPKPNPARSQPTGGSKAAGTGKAAPAAAQPAPGNTAPADAGATAAVTPATPADNDAAVPVDTRPAPAVASDSAATKPPIAAAPADSAAEPAPTEPNRPTYTRRAQVSLLGPLGSNGLRSGQTVNQVSINLLGGYAAGVDGFEAAGLFNVDRDTVAGVQLAGLANVVGRRLEGVQAAGLANVLGGGGTGWQAAGLLNVATRPVVGAQTAGLFNYVGPRKRGAAPAPAPAGGDAGALASADAATPAESGKPAVQVGGLFNVALADMHGGQFGGLFNVSKETNGVQAAGLFNVAKTVRGVQVAGLLNVADSVEGVSLAPLNFVVHGYHRLELTNSETWPLTASLKLGGSAAFYTFFTAAYDGFGRGPRRWGLGYGVGTDVWARRRVSLSLDLVAMQVHEEQQGLTPDLNLHNQLRLLVGLTPFKPGSHFRLVAGPTASLLVTQRYDSTKGEVYSNLSAGRKLPLDEGNATTKVQGWYGYSVGLRF